MKTLTQMKTPTEAEAPPLALDADSLRDLSRAVNAVLGDFRAQMLALAAEADARTAESLPLPAWGTLDEAYAAGYRQAQADAAAAIRESSRAGAQGKGR